jgi:hypothetical protein
VTLPRAATFLLFGTLVACSHQASRAPSLGEAYAGPTTLTLRQELEPKSAIVATVKHGDKLAILEYKRRFVKVRTTQGTEGWTDNHLLLTPQQMNGLRQMAESSSQYPSQGAASVFEMLNMHTEPNRQSPSFWQIPENAKVDVIGHKLAPRTQPATVATAPPPVKPLRRGKKKPPPPPKVAPPPKPPAPKPPDNWIALSVPKKEALEPSVDAPAVPMDDWSLVRTKDAKVGWVLTRMLTMAIPDEVAQYAEGHRITSYFALGEIREGDVVKPNWLWTTITKGQEPFEFDSFRVFVWSHKHHRYETGYIERRVIGHFPVRVDASGSAPSFSVVLEGDGGNLIRKNYRFEGERVRLVSKEPYPPATAAKVEAPKPSTPAAPVQQPAAKERSWFGRIRDRVRHWFH